LVYTIPYSPLALRLLIKKNKINPFLALT
jgi:hypothetical protein